MVSGVGEGEGDDVAEASGITVENVDVDVDVDDEEGDIIEDEVSGRGVGEGVMDGMLQPSML